MSYTDNSAKPVVRSTLFVKVKPRRRVSGWTNTVGNTWEASFDFGEVTGVAIDGLKFDEGSSLPLSSDEFLYDSNLEKVYVFSTTDPDIAKYVVVEYELNFCTESLVFNRDPLDANSEEIYYDGVLTSAPSLVQQASDIIFGFFPLQSSGVSVSNAADNYTRHLYDSSWNRAPIAFFHCLGDLSTANTKKIFSGYVTSINLSNSTLFLEIDNLLKALDQDYAEANQKFFNTTDFPTVDPDAVSTGAEWPIRKVYGMLRGFFPVNIQFGAASTVNNRSWVTSQDNSFVASINRLIDTGGTNNATTTTLTNADGISAGDMMRINHAVGSSYSVLVNSIDYGTKVITHSAIGARTITAGDSVDRFFVRRVYIRDRNDAYYDLYPVTHWNASGFAADTKGFTLINNFEATLGGFPTPFDPALDSLFCDIYGETFIDTYPITATPVTTENQRGGNLNNIAAVIYNILTQIQSAEGFDIDEPSFQDAVTSNIHLIGYCIPATKTTTEYPTYREIINDLLRTGMMRMQVNDFNGSAAIGLSVLKPLEVAPDATVDSSEFSSFDYRVSYQEVYSRVKVLYDQKEAAITLLPGPNDDGPNVFISDDSSAAKYLHKSDRSLEINTFLSVLNGNDAEEYAKRAMYLFSEREATASISGRVNLILSELGQTYKVEREQMPGFERVVGTLNERKFALVESEKSTTIVKVKLNDQKGVEDNAGDW